MSSSSLTKQEWNFFLTRLKQQNKYLIPAFVFAVGAALSQVLFAWIAGKIFNITFISRAWEDTMVLAICGGVISLVAFASLNEFFHRYLLRKALEKMAQKLRIEIFTRYLVFSEAAKSRLETGTAINHIVTDVQLLSEARHFITEMVKEPLTIIALLGYLFYLQWQLCIVCAFALLPIAVANHFLGKSARRNQNKVQGQLAETIQSVNENFQGLRTVHTFLLEKMILKDFSNLMESLVTKLLKITRIEESVGPVIKVISACVAAIILYAGAFLVNKSQSLQAEDLVRFLTAAGLIQAPLRNMSHAGVQIQRISAGAMRIVSLFNIPLDQLSLDQSKHIQSHKTYPIPQKPLALEFSSVSFAYPQNHETAGAEKNPSTFQYALSNINFKLEARKKIALVGKSGSGKTTLSLLALRLIDPSQGQILLDGKNIQEMELGDYRSYFSYVSQEVYFFHGSLKSNMLKVAPQVSDDDIWKALELAQLKERVQRFPQGLETMLSEKAANLSGGERQRLAIARALLRQSPILILDEATSNLDSENERLIQKGLDHLMNDRSAIVIAHRLSTVMNCDEILVFDHGQIVERGHPSDLRGKESTFSKMWSLQQGEALAT
jgi:subfamily B ATP-binding cassette protein MsbA